jgi:two-component system cell cycle response regulator
LATIVLADDDDDLRAVYMTGLKMAGHEVHEASDGHGALALVRARRPDLLLLDIWMPALNGFEVLDALRHDPAGARLRVLVVSNLADADARLAAFEAGASDYVVKGLALADLIARVGRALAEAVVTPELD